jgi:hypothetical protein
MLNKLTDRKNGNIVREKQEQMEISPLRLRMSYLGNFLTDLGYFSAFLTGSLDYFRFLRNIKLSFQPTGS